MCEEELRELGLTLDILYHLETRVLIAVPVLTTNTTLTRDTHTGLHTRCITCSGLRDINTPNALLKKLVNRGLRGGGDSRNAYSLSRRAESDESFSLICGNKCFHQAGKVILTSSLTWATSHVMTSLAMFGSLNLSFSSTSSAGSCKMRSSNSDSTSCLVRLKLY